MARFATLLSIIAAFLTVGCQALEQARAPLPGPNFAGPNMEPTARPPVVIPPIEIAKAPTATPKAPVPAAWVPLANAEKRDWNWIIIHHSATAAGGAKAFDKAHKAKNWDELGYHFVIGNGTDTADGLVEVGSRWPVQKHGAHAKTPDNRYNDHGIGICLVGNFDETRPTARQMASLAKLVAYLSDKYRIPPRDILGHKMTGKQTDCPGRNLDINQVRTMAARQRTQVADDVRSPDMELIQSASR